MAGSENVLRKGVLIPTKGARTTSGVLTSPTEHIKNIGVIVAHGAGNDMNAPLLVAFSDGLAEAGYPSLRFNFPYVERGRKTPDKYDILAETWQSADIYFREQLPEAGYRAAAGKSMGGRVASQMVADSLLSPDCLIFLGYPLHAAGKTAKLRDSHLYRIKAPILFFAGTRDPLCNLDALGLVLNRIPAAKSLHVIEGGDHSFHIPKSAGTPQTEIYDRIVQVTVRWLEGKSE